MPKVFVVQESPGKNLLPASDYGEVEVLLPPNYQMMFSPQPTVRQLRYKLRHFSDQDYLLALGDPTAIGVSCAIASQKTGGRFRMLKWDREQRRYYEVQVDVFDRNQEQLPEKEGTT